MKTSSLNTVPQDRDSGPSPFTGARTTVPKMALGTLLSRLTGLVRIFILTYALGINHLSDSYNLANNTPNIIFDLVLGGIFSATLIPVFVERLHLNRNGEPDRESVSAIVTVSAVILVLASLFTFIFAPAIIDLYTTGTGGNQVAAVHQVSVVLLRCFAPQIALYGLCSLISALLNARSVFSPPMFVPIVNNLICIAMLGYVSVAFAHPSVAYAKGHLTFELVLGLGTTLGVAAQLAMLYPYLRKLHLGLRWTWKLRNPAVRQVVSLSSWTLGFVIANQVTYFIVLALAVHSGRGGVTAYSTAFAFFQLPYGVAVVSIMSAVQPTMALSWSQRNLTRFKTRFLSGLSAINGVVIPASVMMIVVAQPAIGFLLGHGSATVSSTLVISRTLVTFALGLPGFCWYLYLVRAFQTMQDTKTVFHLYLLENAINVFLAIFLVGPFGVEGLALSMSLAYTLAAIVGYAQLAIPLDGIGLASISRPLFRVITLSSIAGLISFISQSEIGSTSTFGMFEKLVVASVVALAVLGAGVWLGLSRQLDSFNT